MNSESWQQVWEIFENALRSPRETRRAFVDQACGGDEDLRRTVDELLAADRENDSFFDRPLVRATGPGPDTPALLKGTAIGPYRLLRRIGQGGMGTVYLAVRADDAFERRVVIKVAKPGMGSEFVIERLRTERRILASLEHPYISRLYDGGTTGDGLPYFVLEYVDGIPIDTYCKQNRLSVDERLTLFRKVCAAVYYAHQNLIVHRDLKPSNILVMADGVPKLLDFGIAKLLKPALDASGLDPTATWQRLLTPSYASPEQIRGKLITTASDVYSLGVLLYKLLTGRLPHRLAGRPWEEVEKIVSESEPLAPSAALERAPEDRRAATDATVAGSRRRPPADELRRQLAGDLDAIVLKALRSAPLRRYSSVEQLAGDLERHQQGLTVTARAGTWRYRAGKFVRRNRKAMAAAAAMALLLVGFAVAMALQAARVAFERDEARRERDKKAQVLELILDLFRFSNPYVAPGGELTVRQTLERSVPVLAAGLGQQPGVRAELLHSSGSILTVLGLYDDARAQLEEAFEIRRRIHGDEHLEVVTSLTALAAAENGLGNYDRAEELARRAVGLARTLLGEGHPGLATPLNELVAVLCHRSEYRAATGLAEETLELVRELPATSDKRIDAHEHLARIRSAAGDYREAVRLNREALALRRARDGERHPNLIPTLNNLGRALRRLGELEAAVRTFEEALVLQRENFGEAHPDPYLLNNLAGVLYAQGKLEDAGSLYRQAHAAVIQIAGEEHWLVFVFELRIARTRIRQDAPAAAEAELRQLLDQWRPVLGDHWRVAEGVGILGESVSVQGRCNEAEPFLVESFERLLGRASQSAVEDGFDRLEAHLHRCAKPEEIPRYKALFEDKSNR